MIYEMQEVLNSLVASSCFVKNFYYLKININSTKKRTAEAKPDAGKA